MTHSGIFLSTAALQSLSPLALVEVQKLAMGDLQDASAGSNPPATPVASSKSDADEEGTTELTVAQAKEFLNTCSDKTTLVLNAIMARDGDLMLSDLCAETRFTPKQLSGVWGGITKRTYTITDDADAYLINWFKVGEDWRLVLATKTVASMQTALAAL